jgi:hypothetical protein
VSRPYLAALLLALAAGALAEDLPPDADLRLGYVSGYLQDRVHTIAFDPGGENFLAAGMRRAALFSTDDGTPRGVLPTPKGKQVLDARLVDAGAHALVVVGNRAAVQGWEDSWEQAAYGGDDVHVQVARLSPDGKLVAVGAQRFSVSEDERATLVRVFLRETGALVHELEMSRR